MINNLEELISKAHSGHSESQYLLAKYYLKKKLKTSEAISWLRKSIEQGNYDAYYSLGLCYMRGEGVKMDVAQGISHYEIAAKNGIFKSAINLKLYYLNLEETEDNLKKAKYWSKIAMPGLIIEAKNKDPLVQFHIGWHYENVTQELDKAKFYYLESAENGDNESQFFIGSCYDEGYLFEKDIAQAIKWYKLGVKNGSHKAQFNLAHCYLTGNGVPKDIKRGKELLLLSRK